MSKSCEQNLIAKVHITTHSYDFLNWLYVYICTLVIKYFYSVKNFSAKILICIFYKLYNPHGMFTFKFEALHLVNEVAIALVSNE